MNTYISSILLIILIVIFDFSAFYYIKKSKQSNFIKYISIVVLLYIGIIGFLYLLDHDIIPGHHLNILRSMISLMMAIVLGTLVFEQKFNKYSILSIILASLAIMSSYISINI